MKQCTAWPVISLLFAVIALSPQIASASDPCDNIASRTARAKQLFQAEEFVKSALIAEDIYKCKGHETRLFLAAMARQNADHCEIAVQHYTYLLKLEGLNPAQKKKLRAGLRESRNACDQVEVSLVVDESRVRAENAPAMPHKILRFEHRSQPHRAYEVRITEFPQTVILGAGAWTASMTFNSSAGSGYRNWQTTLTTEVNVVGDLEITLVPQCTRKLDCPATARSLPHCYGKKCPPKRPAPVVTESKPRPSPRVTSPRQTVRVAARPDRVIDYLVFSSLGFVGAAAGTTGLLLASSANKEIKLLNKTPMTSRAFTNQMNEQLSRRQYAYGSLGAGVGLLLSSGSGWAAARHKPSEKWWLAGEIATGVTTLTIGALILYDVNSAIDDFNATGEIGFPGGARGYWQESKPVYQRASSAAFLLGTGTALVTSGLGKWLWRYFTDKPARSSRARASLAIQPGGASISLGSQF